MKTLILTTAAFCLFSGGLLAQNINEDSAIVAQQQLEWKQALAATDRKLEDRQKLYLEEQTKKPHYDTLGLGLYRYEMWQFNNERRQQEIDFIKAHPNYKVSLEALKDAIGPLPADILIYDKLFRGLNKSIRNSESGKEVRKTIDGFMAVRIGAKAPLFESADTSGNIVSLKSFRGKYVLLDFWASWCIPCREENPNVVKAYEQFKDRSFTVVGISLDQPGKREAWIKAIKTDGLTWTHLSDLKYWNNAVAQLYSIRSIPQNFLIDPNGKIVAANLRGEALIQKLQELLPH
ncbi:MAG: TlpA disulfide reductase family protein [Chitinophagaceae bacterium]